MRYDAVLKKLLTEDPASWVNLLGAEGAETLTLVETEFQTIQATVDKLIRAEGEYTWLIHVEFQAGYHAKIGLRIVRYSAIIEHETGLPVQSVLILLSPDADGPAASRPLI
jgi:predicted transposase YdaD